MAAREGAASKADKKKLFNDLISKGASEKQAKAFSGYTPPETPTQVETAKQPTKPNVPGRRLPSVRVPMSTSKAQRVIFGVMLGVTGLTILGDITSGKANVTDVIPRRIVAGTLAGIMLMILAVPAPKLAASIAGVTAVAVLFVNPSGATVIQKLSNVGSSTKGKSLGGPIVNQPI